MKRHTQEFNTENVMEMCFSSQTSCGFHSSPISAKLPALCAFQALSLAEQKGQLQTAKSAVLCFALTKAEKLQCVQIITSFCFACWFEV